MKGILICVIMMMSAKVFAEADMNQTSMEEVVKSVAEKSTGGNGFVEFTFQGMVLYLISDTKHDRMRIITPVVEYSQVAEQEKDTVLISNFHSALDARYAVSEGVLYAAYIHPLSSLSEEQIKNAVIQVFNLRASYGSSYASNVLSYGGGSSH